MAKNQVAIPDPDDDEPIDSVAIPVSEDISSRDSQMYLWQTALSGDVDSTFVFESADLEQKRSLIGVPFIVTRAVFRAGTNLNVSGYVSVEGIVAPYQVVERAVARGKVPGVSSMDDPKLPTPGSKIVFNDGSTGVRADLMRAFQSAGIIDIGPESHSDNEDRDFVGKKIWRKPPEEWASCTQTVPAEHAEGGEWDQPDIRFMPDGTTPLTMFAMTGLRVSEYTYEGQAAETYYLG
jgi:hypothetical protein